MNEKNNFQNGVQQDPDLLFSEIQAAVFLNFSMRTLQEWRRRGGGPFFVEANNRCIRYRRSDLIKWIDKNTRTSTSSAPTQKVFKIKKGDLRE